MDEIGIFEAKTRFSEIAKRVKETGRPVRVTNRGQEMVDIIPVASQSVGKRTKSQALAELAELRRSLPKMTSQKIKADIAHGRR